MTEVQDTVAALKGIPTREKTDGDAAQGSS